MTTEERNDQPLLSIIYLENPENPCHTSELTMAHHDDDDDDDDGGGGGGGGIIITVSLNILAVPLFLNIQWAKKIYKLK